MANSNSKISNCIFNNILSDAVIEVLWSTKFEIFNCIFEKIIGNGGDYNDNGGALRIYRSEYFFINNCTFINNFNVETGGAISIEECDEGYLSNLIFDSCSANYGGAISILGSID